jgi:hypothetical protein
VGLGQGPANLPQQPDGLVGRERPFGPGELVERRPSQEFHDIVKRAVLGTAVVEDLDRIGVRQSGGGRHFPGESRQQPRVAGPLRCDEFDRARPPK